VRRHRTRLSPIGAWQSEIRFEDGPLCPYPSLLYETTVIPLTIVEARGVNEFDQGGQRNGGQRSAGASSMRVRNTGSAVASAQPTVSPAWISWVKSSASGAIVIGVFTRLLALSARPEWVEQNQLFRRPEGSGISDP